MSACFRTHWLSYVRSPVGWLLSSFYRVHEIRGYHDYKPIWSDPTLEEELECKREPGNPHDTHAVAVIKAISGSSVTVGYLPGLISPIY